MNSCVNCPLNGLTGYRSHSKEQSQILESLKRDERFVEAGATVIREHDESPPLFTLLSGWAFRYKTLPDARRQILGVLLPGDLIGVQQHMDEASAHGVEALSALTLCRFERDALWRLHRDDAVLSFTVTWLVAAEERLIDSQLLSVGRRSAQERMAALLVNLFVRARRAGAQAVIAPDSPESVELPPNSISWPLTQQHIADLMGLSLVHTNKTLRRLQKGGFYEIKDRVLTLLDPRALQSIAQMDHDELPSRYRAFL